MRAVHQHGRGALDIGFVDVAFVERHVGAVLAIENQRESIRIADAQDDERSETFGIGFHAAYIDAIACKFFADETAHVIAADAGDETGL